LRLLHKWRQRDFPKVARGHTDFAGLKYANTSHLKNQIRQYVPLKKNELRDLDLNREYHDAFVPVT
jgi:hypothetical protein